MIVKFKTHEEKHTESGTGSDSNMFIQSKGSVDTVKISLSPGDAINRGEYTIVIIADKGLKDDVINGLLIHEESNEPFGYNLIAVSGYLKDGAFFNVLSDLEAFICNDEGQTVERLRP